MALMIDSASFSNFPAALMAGGVRLALPLLIIIFVLFSFPDLARAVLQVPTGLTTARSALRGAAAGNIVAFAGGIDRYEPL